MKKLLWRSLRENLKVEISFKLARERERERASNFEREKRKIVILTLKQTVRQTDPRRTDNEWQKMKKNIKMDTVIKRHIYRRKAKVILEERVLTKRLTGSYQTERLNETETIEG